MRKIISIVVGGTFFCNILIADASLGQPLKIDQSTLSQWTVTENPLIQREFLAALFRKNRLIHIADKNDRYRSMLDSSSEKAMRLSSGLYLMTEETANNDLELIKAATKEDFKVLMELEERSGPEQYEKLKNLVLKNERIWNAYFKLSQYKDINKKPENVLLNDLIATAFKLYFLTENRVLPRSELSADEREFLASARPLLEAGYDSGRSEYFPETFFDINKRTKIVWKLQTEKTKKEHHFEGAERARDLLLDWERRPEPHKVANLAVEDIREGEKMAFGTDNTDRYLNSKTFRELENILPYIEKIVVKILSDYPDYTILIAGRDAELLYDALKTIFMDIRRKKPVRLFPGTLLFMESLYMLDKTHPEHGRKLQERFLLNHGITPEAIKTGEKFLIVDTGFIGDVGRGLRDLIAKVYVELDLKDAEKAVQIKLIGTFPESPFGVLIPLDLGWPQMKELFPKTTDLVESNPIPQITDKKILKSPYFIVPVVLQLMPHHHGRYGRLGFSEKELFIAMPAEKDEIRRDIDAPEVYNDSIINPVAAMLVQRRVIEYFRGEREDILSGLSEKKNAAPEGAPAELLKYMHRNGVFSDKPKKAKEMAGKRGGKDSRSTILRKLRVLKAMGLAGGNGRSGYYLYDWLRDVTPKEIIRFNPEIETPNPTPGQIEMIAARVEEKRKENRIRDILLDDKNRPEPAEIEGFSMEDIRRGAKLALGDDNIYPYLRSKTFMELENALPFVYEMVKKIMNDFLPEHTILITGRDAEIFYDAFKTILGGTKYEEKIKLFPGSRSFMEHLKYSAPVSWQKEYFVQFGITPELIKKGSKYLLLDTGFKGTIAKRLHRRLKKLFGPELDKDLMKTALQARLVGETIPFPQASQLMSFENGGVSLFDSLMEYIRPPLEEKFPKTDPVAKSIFNTGRPISWINNVLASAIQLLPHYHEEYTRLDRAGDGRLIAVPDERKDIQADIDRVEHTGDSVVNPVAAMLVQRRVIEYFRARRKKLLQKARSKLNPSGGAPAPEERRRKRTGNPDTKKALGVTSEQIRARSTEDLAASPLKKAFSVLDASAKSGMLRLENLLAAFGQKCRNLNDISLLRLCLPAEVFKNAPDFMLALRRFARENSAVKFELVITGVKDEDIAVIDGLNDALIRHALDMPEKLKVKIITERVIREIAENPRYDYDRQSAGGRAMIVKDMYIGTLKEGEFMAIATDAVPEEEAPSLENILKNELENNISIRVLVAPEPHKGIGAYSLSAIIDDWIGALNEDRKTSIGIIMPMPVSLLEDLDEAVKYAWKALVAA